MKFKRAIASHVACLLATTSGAALAQTAIPTPNTNSTVDGNGVDLSSGSLQITDPGVSIGAPTEGGLAHTRTWLGSAWTHGFMLTMNTTSTTATVSMGAKSIKFTLVNGTYVPDARDGTSLTVTSSAYTFTMSDGTVVTFDRSLATNSTSYYGAIAAAGTLIAMPNGEKVTLTYKRASYSSGGTKWVLRLQSVENNLGYQLKYEYASNSLSASTISDWARMSTVRAINKAQIYCDPNADVCAGTSDVSYLKSASGSNTLETVISHAGIRHYFTTDPSGRMINVQSDTSGADAVHYDYDSVGRVAGAQRGSGGYYEYIWTLNGTTLTGEMDGPGSAYMQVVSDTSKSNVISITDSLGNTTAYTYDTYGRLKKVTAPDGNSIEYFYDDRGNIYQKNENAKPGTSDDGVLQRAVYPTNCTNAVTCNKPTSTEDAGRATNYTYDGSTGQVLSITYPPADVNAVRPQVRYEYSPLQAYYKSSSGSIVASGQTVSMLTAVKACRTSASCSGGADEIRTTISYGAQSAGTANNLRPVSRTQAGNGLSSTVSMTYDYIGNLLTVDGPLSGDNDKIRYRYDLDRRLVGTIYADPDGTGTRRRLASRTEYNADNRPTSIVTGLVDDLTEGAWNAFTPAFKRVMTYNANGLLSTDALVAPSGTTQYQITQYEYDYLNRPYCVAVRMNAPTTSTALPYCTTHMTAGSHGPDRISYNVYYGGSNRVYQSVTGAGTPNNRATHYTYSKNGKLLTVSDGNNNKTTYEYDGLDRLTKTRYPSKTKGANSSSTTDYEQITYDEKGNVTQVRLRDSATISMGYDNLDRVISMGGSTIPDRTFSYDLQGRITQATQPGNGFTHTFTYDGLGRLASEVQPYGSASYQYDVAGRRTRLTWSDGFYVTYDYDGAGNITAIRENGAASGVGVLATYSYDNYGRRTAVNRGNGTVSTYGYDAASRLATLVQNLSGTSNDLARGFTYTPSNQVASATASNTAYDWNGYVALNRSYTSNGLNQYTLSGATSLAYDARGNLTTSGSSTYGYNGFNQMTSAPGGVTLTYDALGRLVQTAGGSTTRFAYDGSAMIAEYNSSNALLRRFVPGPGTDEPIVWYEGSGTSDRRWLHADERGSVIAVTDGSGAAINLNSYDEFGIPASTNIGRFQYTGQAWLPEIGMYYYKARMYSPTLGRFMQTDPIGYGDGLNIYAYAGNDPINAIDPTGTDIEVWGSGGYDWDWGWYQDWGWAYYDLPSFGGVWGGGDVSDISEDGQGNPVVTVTAKRPPKANTQSLLPGILWTTPWAGAISGGVAGGEPQNGKSCSTAVQIGAAASNINLVLEGSAAVLGVGALVTSPTGVGGGVLGAGAAGAAAGAKIASVVSIGAYGYDYLTTGNTSSLTGAGAGVVSLVASGIATKITGNIMRNGRMFGNLSAPQKARLGTAESAYGSAAGMVENLLVDTGC